MRHIEGILEAGWSKRTLTKAGQGTKTFLSDEKNLC